MIVTCERCQVRFNLDDNLIKESGSKVRCSKCHHIFTAYKPALAEEEGLPFGLEEVKKRPAFEEAAGAKAAEVSGAFPEESIDFGALEPTEDRGEEEFSLEDLGLEDEFSLEDTEGTAEELAQEDEFSMDDLGLDEDITAEGVSEPKEEPALEEELEGDFDLEGLDLGLEEEVAPEEAIPSTEEIGAEKGEADEADISFEDFRLEEESAPEPLKEEELEEEPEEEILIGEPGKEEVPTEEAPAWMEPHEELELEEEAPSEDMAVPSEEEAEEYGEEAFTPPMVEEAPRERKRISTPILALIVILLVGGGAYAAYTLLKSHDIKIPFLASLMGERETQEEGMKLLDHLVTGAFLDNQSLGRLFVIKGEVRNEYPEPRNFMRVKGAIYSKDGKLLQEQIVYCGNVLPDDKLQTLDMPVIQRVLNNRFGANKSNFQVPSGTALPFMVVFSDLPDELGEYSVEIVDSVSG